MRLVAFAFALVGLTFLSGCEEGKQAASGSVKFDGVALAEGDMVFEPEDKNKASEGAKIKDGKYSVNISKGKYKVRITANRPVPGKKGPMGEDAIEQYIPAKYNDSTTLSADFTDKKTADFDLTK